MVTKVFLHQVTIPKKISSKSKQQRNRMYKANCLFIITILAIILSLFALYWDAWNEEEELTTIHDQLKKEHDSKSIIEDDRIMEQLQNEDYYYDDLFLGEEDDYLYYQEALEKDNLQNKTYSHATEYIPSKQDLSHVKLQNLISQYKNKAAYYAKQSLQNAKSNQKPTKSHPFVFLHQRKAGGTSFKTHLFQISQNLDLKHYIAGMGRVIWGVFDIPNIHNQNHELYEIYAGHFNYMNIFQNLGLKDFSGKETTKVDSSSSSEEPFSCIINARPTTDRVVSCWNYFFLQLLKVKTKNAYELVPDEWNEYLPTAFSQFHHGCNNEFIRNFHDSRNEEFINTLHKDNSNQDVLAEVLEQVLERVSKCTILLLPKCEESATVIQKYHKWMKLPDSYCGTKYNVGKEDKQKEELSQEAKDVILEWNYLDDLVYDYLEVLFDEQFKLSR